MPCPAILTGQRFLGATFAHIDCQARTIGAYGYGALANPGSAVAHALIALLTIFIALFGLRLLLGHPFHGRDAILSVIKIGLVLTLATSWPALRVLGYDLLLDGPTDIARTIGAASGLPGSRNDLTNRLQNADDGIVAMTTWGSGRLTGGVVGGTDLGDSFHGIALADQFALGSGRVAFLAGTVAPFAILRLGTGILLALTPLVAGLLLFSGTVGLFIGWLRGLLFCALASIALSLVQGIELAILEPWFTDVIARREAGLFTPSSPTELLVIALSFALVTFGMLFLTARIAFNPPSLVPAAMPQIAWPVATGARGELQWAATRSEIAAPSRALVVSEAVAATMRREERISSYSQLTGGSAAAGRSTSASPEQATAPSARSAANTRYSPLLCRPASASRSSCRRQPAGTWRWRFAGMSRQASNLTTTTKPGRSSRPV